MAVPPSRRVGFPSTLTFLPMKSSAFHPSRFALTAPVLAVIRQVTGFPVASGTSTSISECGLTSLKEVTTPSIATVLDMSKNVLNEW
jgi:hypothetical protein